MNKRNPVGPVKAGLCPKCLNPTLVVREDEVYESPLSLDGVRKSTDNVYYEKSVQCSECSLIMDEENYNKHVKNVEKESSMQSHREDERVYNEKNLTNNPFGRSV